MNVDSIPRKLWRRLDKRLRVLLIVVAVPVAVAWITFGSIATFLLIQDPMRGCPPTMGCPVREANECSSWGGFIHPARAREACQDDR